MELIEVDPEFFSQVIPYTKSSLSPRIAWRIDEHDAEYYKSHNARCYVSPKGSALAITDDGTILSLCKHRDDHDNFLGLDMVEFAKENGGCKLQCYEGMSDWYLESGFVEIARIGWDHSSTPKGWRPEYGIEDQLVLEHLDWLDDFNDCGIGRERVVELLKSPDIQSCEYSVEKMIEEMLRLDDQDMQLMCLDLMQRALEKKGFSTERMRLSKDLTDRFEDWIQGLVHDKNEHELVQV
jgi:hypothetical protein